MGFAIASAAAPIVGGVIGQLASGDDREKAAKAYQDAINEINSIGAPPDLSQEIFLEKFQQAGVLTPKLEEAINVERSRMEQIQVPSQYKQAQEKALSTLAERGRGLTAEDRAAQTKILQAQQRETEAKRQQILQGMAQRGMGGSGADLIAQLQANQAAAEEGSQRSVDLSGQASQRALEAMMKSGQLAGDIRGQEFREQSDVASAADRIAMAKYQNEVARQQRNVGGLNEAERLNLENKQRIMDLNIGQTNQEKRRQVEAKRQFWQDQMNRAQMRSGAMTQQGNLANQAAAQTQQFWGSMGQGVGAGASGVGQYYSNKSASDSAAARQSAMDARQAKMDESQLAMEQAKTNYFNKLNG